MAHKALPQWKRDRARKLDNKYDNECYRYEPATGPQRRALGIMIENASKRECSLDPDIPLSKYDICHLFRIFKGKPPRGAKIGLARLFRRLSEANERAGNIYSWKFTPSYEDIERVDPEDHPLYEPPWTKHMKRTLDDLADEWEDDMILDEIRELEAELPFIECPYEQQTIADRMASLSAQLGG